MTMASAPRGTIPPVAISVAVPGTIAEKRLPPRGEDFGVQGQPAGHALAGAKCVVGADREAVDTGAVEAGDIDIGDDPARQNAAKRLRKRDKFAPERAQIQMAVKRAVRLVAIDNFEKLFLLCQAAEGRRRYRSSCRSAPMSAPVIKICRHRCSMWIPLARLGNDDKAVGAGGGHQSALGKSGHRLDLSRRSTCAPGRFRSRR